MQGWAFLKKCSHSFVAFFKKAIIFPATAGYGYTQPSQVTQNGSYDYAKVVNLVPYGRLRYNPFFWTAFCTVLERFHTNPVL